MKRSLLIIFLAAAFLFSCNQKHELVNYPSPRPDSTILTFLPGIVSTDSLDFNACFSPDGQAFYFSRVKNGISHIYVTRNDGTHWSEPVMTSFNSDRYSEADPAFSSNGNLYFISDRLTSPLDTTPDFDIWFVKPLPDEKWSSAENFEEINSDSTEFYISFARNGNVYFGSSRSGGFGSVDIYRSESRNGKYELPKNLGEAINTSASEHDPVIEPEEKFIIYKSEFRADGLGEADLYCSILNDNQWMKAKNLGAPFNTTAYEFCPYLTPDGKYFFLTSARDVKWTGMRFLTKRIEELYADSKVRR